MAVDIGLDSIRPLATLSIAYIAFLLAVLAPEPGFISAWLVLVVSWLGGPQSSEPYRYISLVYVLVSPALFFAAAVAAGQFRIKGIARIARTILALVCVVSFLDIFLVATVVSGASTAAAAATNTAIALSVFAWNYLFLSMIRPIPAGIGIGQFTWWRADCRFADSRARHLVGR